MPMLASTLEASRGVSVPVAGTTPIGGPTPEVGTPQADAALEAVVSDLDAVYHQVETAISAYNSGSFENQHLEDVRQAAAAAKENAQALIAVPAGRAVPDGDIHDGEADATDDSEAGTAEARDTQDSPAGGKSKRK